MQGMGSIVSWGDSKKCEGRKSGKVKKCEISSFLVFLTDTHLLLVQWQILCECHVGVTLCGGVGVGVVKELLCERTEKKR